MRLRPLTIALAALTLLAVTALAFGPLGRGGAAIPILSATEAHDRAMRGALTLIDIRRPDEWQTTGLPSPAAPLDMRRDDFAEALANLVGGDKSAPIALICARGVRSARQSRWLRDAGFDNISNIAEGMLGSRHGPGWVARGLPRRIVKEDR